MDQLTASIDASSDEKMKSLRGIPLQSVVDGLMGLNEIKRRLRRLAPEIHLNFTCSIQNIGDLTALVEIAETMNVRQINVNLQKIYSRKQRDDTLLLHREEARAEFSRAEDAARGRGIRLVLPTLDETGKVCRQIIADVLRRQFIRPVARGCPIPLRHTGDIGSGDLGAVKIRHKGVLVSHPQDH